MGWTFLPPFQLWIHTIMQYSSFTRHYLSSCVDLPFDLPSANHFPWQSRLLTLFGTLTGISVVILSRLLNPPSMHTPLSTRHCNHNFWQNKSGSNRRRNRMSSVPFNWQRSMIFVWLDSWPLKKNKPFVSRELSLLLSGCMWNTMTGMS